MNTKKLVIGVVVLGLIVAGLVLPRGNTVVERIIQAGAVSGPDSFFNCETHNGVQTCFTKRGFLQATSTVVDIVSPAATSTLTYASCSYIGATGATTNLRMFKGATFNATTTLLAQRTTAASGALNYPLIASTTPVAAAETTLMFQPNNHFVFELNGVVNQSLTGSCSVEFKTI